MTKEEFERMRPLSKEEYEKWRMEQMKLESQSPLYLGDTSIGKQK